MTTGLAERGLHVAGLATRLPVERTTSSRAGRWPLEDDRRVGTHSHLVQEGVPELIVVHLRMPALRLDVGEGTRQRVVVIFKASEKRLAKLALTYVPRRTQNALEIHRGLAMSEAISVPSYE